MVVAQRVSNHAVEGGVRLGETDRRSSVYIKWVQEALNRLAGAGLAVDGRLGPRTRGAVKAFQRGRGLPADGVVGSRTEAALVAAGAPRPPVTATSAPTTSPVPPGVPLYADVVVPLPTPGPGYYSYHKPPKNQFGLAETIRALQAIGVAWSRAHPSGPRIGIGDISRYGGGKLPPHKSHQLGVDVDIRLMRNDGREAGVRYQDDAYSRELTQELIRGIQANGVLRVKVIYFNDPVVIRSIAGVQEQAGHDDHLHVRFFPPSKVSGRETDNEEAQGETDRRSPRYVRWVQSSLNQIMRTGVTADGRFGPETRKAVQAFQRQRGLAADGVVGPATERALIAAGATPLSTTGQAVPSRPAPTKVPSQGAPSVSAPVAMNLAALSSPATQPTAANIVATMRAICGLHAIPFALGLTVLDHECPGNLDRGFRHPDGLMQTISSARTSVIPRIPRPLARVLLGVPTDARVDDSELNRRLHAEFSRRVAVQVAAGVQEIVEGLRAFNGYVAPALIAYNAGKGNAARIVTQGQAKRRPAGTSDASWESMCRLGAAMLHQPPSAVNVAPGRWRCDVNIPAWHREFQIRDRPTALLLVAYQYLRSVPACIREHRPQEACTAATKSQRREGSGQMKCANTRMGALDKLYEPRRLRRELFDAAAGALVAIVDDGRPLRVEAGQFVKAPLASQASP